MWQMHWKKRRQRPLFFAGGSNRKASGPWPVRIGSEPASREIMYPSRKHDFFLAMTVLFVLGALIAQGVAWLLGYDLFPPPNPLDD